MEQAGKRGVIVFRPDGYRDFFGTLAPVPVQSGGKQKRTRQNNKSYIDFEGISEYFNNTHITFK